MATVTELDRIIKPLISDIIDQVVEASSGVLPPTEQVISRHVEDATQSLRIAILTHFAEASLAEKGAEPTLDTEAIVVRGTN